jgi:transcriptional regulator with XRE-family HTH domain
MVRLSRRDQEQVDHELYEAELLSELVVNRVRELMRQRGVSAAALAKKLDVSEARVSQLLAPGTNLTLRSLAGLGVALGCRFGLELTPTDRDETVDSVQRPGDAAAVERAGVEARAQMEEVFEQARAEARAQVTEAVRLAESLLDMAHAHAERADDEEHLAPLERAREQTQQAARDLMNA